MQLTDGVVLLRPPVNEDIASLYEAVKFSLPELEPWMDWATGAYSLSSAQNWLDFVQAAWSHNTSFHFVIIETKTNMFLGCCGLDGINLQKKECNLGYWIRSDRAKKGIASRSSRLLVDFAFSKPGIERIEIVAGVENIASQKVALKIGAQLTGPTAKPMVVHDQVKEALLFVINKI